MILKRGKGEEGKRRKSITGVMRITNHGILI